MADVTFDAVTPNGFGGSTYNNFNFTHTPIGTPTAVVVWVFGSYGAVQLAEYGGETLTEGIIAGPHNTYCFTLLAPPSGAKVVNIDLTNTTRGGCVAMTFVGEVGSFGTLIGDTDIISNTVTDCLNGGMVVDGGCKINDVAWTVGAGQTQRSANAYGSTNGNNARTSTEPGTGGDVVMSWTNVADMESLGAIAINPPAISFIAGGDGGFFFSTQGLWDKLNGIMQPKKGLLLPDGVTI